MTHGINSNIQHRAWLAKAGPRGWCSHCVRAVRASVRIPMNFATDSGSLAPAIPIQTRHPLCIPMTVLLREATRVQREDALLLSRARPTSAMWRVAGCRALGPYGSTRPGPVIRCHHARGSFVPKAEVQDQGPPTAVQRSRSLGRADRTHAGLHQVVAGHVDRALRESRRYDVQRSYASHQALTTSPCRIQGVLLGFAPPNALHTLT